MLEIGRGNRPDIYDFFYRRPAPLVPRHLRREVPERLAADGAVLEPLDLDAVDREAASSSTQGVEAIAVCFLHAYANPEHERARPTRDPRRHPGVFVTASHEVATEWREYERTSSTVLNAYVQPLFASYLDGLERGLRERRLRRHARDHAVERRRDGAGRGRASCRSARSSPARPAASSARTRSPGELGRPNVICADVGGTSFDVALIDDGADPSSASETDVGAAPDRRARRSTSSSIGAGGGSIAWIDDRGVAAGRAPRAPARGPARPASAAAAREPTVTDCNVLLGRLDPERFLGARMRLDVAAAEAAFDERRRARSASIARTAAAGVLRDRRDRTWPTRSAR